MSETSSECTLSTLYNVSEADILDARICIPILLWALTTRYEAEYAAGQSTTERTKQYLKHVNCAITRLQESGIRTDIIELPVEQSVIKLDLERDMAFIGAWASDETCIGQIPWSEYDLA